MPTNRKRIMREKKGQQGLDGWLNVFATIYRYIGGQGPNWSFDGWTFASGLAFWNEHHAEIMERFPSWQQENDKALFQRFFEFWLEIEPKHPRRIVRYEEGWTCRNSPAPAKWIKWPVYEDNQRYLTRLGLLTPLEKSALEAEQQKTEKRNENNKKVLDIC
jgi:hypothetical protein